MPPTEYEAAHMKYRELVKKAAGGDKAAHADKVKAMNEIRAIERDAARAGTVLSAQYKADKVAVSSEESETKRSLQEEYCRKFENEATVDIGGKEQTLRQYHKKRLFGK